MKSQSKALSKSLFVTLVVMLTLFVSGTVLSFSDTTQVLKVADALKQREGTSLTVQGYIVGQPVAANAVLNSGFKSDTAIALADSPTESDTAKMIYIQVPSKYRSAFGLQSNSGILGKTVNVSGEWVRYFSHEGVKNVVAIEYGTPANGGDDNGNDNGNGNGNGSDNGNGNGSDNGNTTPGTTTEYDNTYYKNAIGKRGEALKSSLHDIIDEHTVISYSAVWDGICATDEDPNNPNNVILLYTGRSQGKNTKGSGVDNWNREHVWAKSRGDFGTSPGPGTDLHHLRATDVSVNATRSNFYFDEISSNGEAVRDPEATGCFYIKNREVWEPRDEVKGDIARMLFYMAVRYETHDGVDLELNNAIVGSKDPYMGNLSVLLEWNRLDKVDAQEIRRNNVIYKDFQHNRNPFIDHPEWADLIWAS